MKKLKKLCGAVLIAGFMLPQIALGSTDTAEAASGKWKQDGKKWWYSYSDGTYPKSKWEKINGKWYHFDKWGYMQTGWQKISGKWYYFGTNGIMKTGWQKIGGKWYYFASGVMKTGWLKSGGKWYYFNGDGSMVTGTKTIGGKKYTFGSDGVMMEGSSNKAASLANAKVGDIITFGQYEQDNNTSNGKEAIEWLVLDRKKDGSLLVTSKYALDCQQYNTEYDAVSWKTCTLRTWLNSTFMDSAFSSDEKALISKTTLTTEGNASIGSVETMDQMFILDGGEAWDYAVDNNCAPTAYAIAQGVSFLIDDDEFCIWWLRDYDFSQPETYIAHCANGYIFNNVTGSNAVRPAMWIKP